MKNIYDSQEFFDAYAKMERSNKGLEGAGEWHQLQPLLPDLKNKKVLDLGCGYGWHCKYAVTCGAQSVLGIDGSEKMIEAAKQKNSDPKITYEVADLIHFAYPKEEYDCVISNLVLHYIEDLSSVFTLIYETLTPGGVFVFNIEHPVFTSGVNQDWLYDEDDKPLYWPIDDYFYPGVRETRFLGSKVVKQHHTLTQIINGLLKTNFSIEAVEEAMPPQNMMDLPGMADEMKRPMMLLVRVKK